MSLDLELINRARREAGLPELLDDAALDAAIGRTPRVTPFRAPQPVIPKPMPQKPTPRPTTPAMTKEGRARRSAATRVGVPWEEYERRYQAGERWCWVHKGWHPLAAFGPDTSRESGVSGSCRDGKNALAKRMWPQRGRRNWPSAYKRMTPETCGVCKRTRAKYGTPCLRHGGPARGTAWKHRKMRKAAIG